MLVRYWGAGLYSKCKNKNAKCKVLMSFSFLIFNF